mgnify:CR=1 FL=1
MIPAALRELHVAQPLLLFALAIVPLPFLDPGMYFTRDDSGEYPDLGVDRTHEGAMRDAGYECRPDLPRALDEVWARLGRAGTCTDSVLQFSDDLAANIARGDANYLAMLETASDHGSFHAQTVADGHGRCATQLRQSHAHHQR